jgi:HD-GYP domain-containing protein (c-di-GMP phosphodiesterase class II)
MAGTAQKASRATHHTQPDPPGGAAIIEGLNQAETGYQQLLHAWQEQSRHLQRAREEKERISKEYEALKHDHTDVCERLERLRERSARYATGVRDIYRSLFTGNIYDLILRACCNVTGGTRGLYVTARGPDDLLKVRSAIDVDGYPQAPPSPFIEALCRKVLADRQTFICNRGDDNDLPAPTNPGEQFHSCIVAPVMLLKNLDGILIVADKAVGEFSEEDVQIVLSVGDQAGVVVENKRLHRELQNAYVATVTLLADAVEAKDPYTHGHCDMVSHYARRTAAALNLSDVESSIVCYAALLHDVGKIGVSDGILNKPGPLIPEERDLMRAHVRIGHDLLSHVPALKMVADVVLHHHEWYDGNGYPDGLKGDKIPIAARIVSVVDAYGAMITKRSYKEAYSDEHARAELVRCAGTQFDPDVVQAFLAVLDTYVQPDWDDEEGDECGLLPTFINLPDFRYLSQ